MFALDSGLREKGEITENPVPDIVDSQSDTSPSKSHRAIEGIRQTGDWPSSVSLIAAVNVKPSGLARHCSVVDSVRDGMAQDRAKQGRGAEDLGQVGGGPFPPSAQAFM